MIKTGGNWEGTDLSFQDALCVTFLPNGTQWPFFSHVPFTPFWTCLLPPRFTSKFSSHFSQITSIVFKRIWFWIRSFIVSIWSYRNAPPHAKIQNALPIEGLAFGTPKAKAFRFSEPGQNLASAFSRCNVAWSSGNCIVISPINHPALEQPWPGPVIFAFYPGAFKPWIPTLGTTMKTFIIKGQAFKIKIKTFNRQVRQRLNFISNNQGKLCVQGWANVTESFQSTTPGQLPSLRTQY